MKLQLGKKIFEKVISNSLGFIDEHSISGVFDNVLIEAVNQTQIAVTATDANAHTGITSIMTAESIQQVESFLIHAKKLDSFLRSLESDRVDFESADKGVVALKGGKSKFKIPVSSISEYVNRPEITGTPFEINIGKLLFLIKKTWFAISSDPTRHKMRGGFLTYDSGKIIMVSTDGFQLAYAEIQEESDLSSLFKNGIMIAKEDLDRIRKILETFDPSENIKITIMENSLSLHLSDSKEGIASTVWLRLLGSDFVSYKSIFRAEAYKIIGNRKEFQKVLKRASLTTAKDAPVLRFDLEPNTISIQSQDDYSYKFDESFDVAYNGKNITIGISGKFLSDMITRVDSEYFVLDVESENSIIMISSDMPSGERESDRAYFYILMPMDIN